jgi:hypothetical protein
MLAVAGLALVLAGCNCDTVPVRDAGQDEVATALGGLRWELPCAGAHAGDGCATGATVRTALTLPGDPATTFDATLRFRGVVELVRVDGGTGSEHFREGGALETVGYNAYSLEVASPQAVYFLNAGQSGPRRTFPVDYTRTIPLRGGSLLTLVANPRDGAELINTDGDGGTNVIPGIPPAPLAFDGQFLQLDVVSVVPR